MRIKQGEEMEKGKIEIGKKINYRVK